MLFRPQSSTRAPRSPDRHRHRQPRFLWRWALALLILGSTAALVLWQLSWVAPLEYRPPDAADELVIALAQDVEKRLAEELHAVRPGEDRWTLRVREHQVNAWLATRLESWVAHEQKLRWPRSLQRPQVAFRDGRVRLFLEVTMPGSERARVITADLRPHIDDEGLWLPVQQISFGMIPLPGEPMERLARLVEEIAPAGNIDHAAFTELLDIFAGRVPVLPIFSLADRRRVQILAMHFEHGYVDVTSQTLRRGVMAQFSFSRDHDHDSGADGNGRRSIGSIE